MNITFNRYTFFLSSLSKYTVLLIERTIFPVSFSSYSMSVIRLQTSSVNFYLFPLYRIPIHHSLLSILLINVLFFLIRFVIPDTTFNNSVSFFPYILFLYVRVFRVASVQCMGLSSISSLLSPLVIIVVIVFVQAIFL